LFLRSQINLVKSPNQLQGFSVLAFKKSCLLISNNKGEVLKSVRDMGSNVKVKTWSCTS